MIIIKTTKTDHLFKYRGDIEIDNDDTFITITAAYIVKGIDELDTYSSRVIDKFYSDEIEYIRGQD